MNKKNNAIALTIFAAIFFLIVAANIFQPERETFSEEEKRDLAKFPKFSIETLANGKYFAGIDSFVSDTFIFRSELIQLSRKINTLWSASTFFGTKEDEIIFISTDTPIIDIKIDPPLWDIKNDNNENKDNSQTEITENPTDSTEQNEVANPTEQDPITETEEPKENNNPEPGESIENNENETKEPVENNDPTTDLPIMDNEPLTEEPTESEPTEEPVPDSNLTDIKDPHGVGEPELLASGHIIYNNAVYSIPYLVPSVAEYYADVISYYQYLGS